MDRCTAYCKKQNYAVVERASDKGISGKIRRRDGLDLCIRSLQPGFVLVVDRSDRLARDMLVSLMIHAEVEKIGATIEFADGSPLRSTPEGKLFQNILAAFANFEREKFSERTKNGMAKKKKEGVWCGRPPYGKKKLVGIDHLCVAADELDVIFDIKKLRGMGYTASLICCTLNKRGTLCRGKPWNPKTIRRILARNP
jgi:DNA invertase Pin-like site-specific DNA recombinase